MANKLYDLIDISKPVTETVTVTATSIIEDINNMTEYIINKRPMRDVPVVNAVGMIVGWALEYADDDNREYVSGDDVAKLFDDVEGN